jgi:hypothetical protein
MKKIKNKNQGEKMKNKLNIVDLIALATAKPQMFKDNKQLAFILDVKMKIINDMYKQYKKEKEVQ